MPIGDLQDWGHPIATGIGAIRIAASSEGGNNPYQEPWE